MTAFSPRYDFFLLLSSGGLFDWSHDRTAIVTSGSERFSRQPLKKSHFLALFLVLGLGRKLVESED